MTGSMVCPRWFDVGCLVLFCVVVLGLVLAWWCLSGLCPGCGPLVLLVCFIWCNAYVGCGLYWFVYAVLSGVFVSG